LAGISKKHDKGGFGGFLPPLVQVVLKLKPIKTFPTIRLAQSRVYRSDDVAKATYRRASSSRVFPPFELKRFRAAFKSYRG